jgi:signal transduction histidine kinase/ActR/RegA family two-component response regulator
VPFFRAVFSFFLRHCSGRIAITTLLLTGIGFSISLWYGAVRSELALVQAQFSAAASNRALAVERELAGFQKVGQAVAELLATEREMPEEELLVFLALLEGEDKPIGGIVYESPSRRVRWNPTGIDAMGMVADQKQHAWVRPCRGNGGGSCLGIELPVERRNGKGGGSLLLVQPLGPIIEKALGYLKPHGADVSIRHQGQVVFEHNSRMRRILRAGTWEKLRGGIDGFEQNLNLYDLKLVLTCQAVPGYLDAASTWQPWGVLFSGFAATFFLGGLFIAVVRHARGVESLVGERTAQLKQARDEAIEASAVKSRFVANVSHELRTPLNGVLGLTQLMLLEELPKLHRERCEVIQQSGTLLLHLIEDLLDFSKLEAGQIKLEKSRVELDATIRMVAACIAPLAEAKGLGLKVEIEAGVPDDIETDPMRLRQVLINLLGNAVKFTESGSIGLQVERAGDRVRFVVTDSGPGISKEVIPRLFERFVQGDSSSVRRYGGAGLGLSIVKELLHLMGGRIWVESELGKGSAFFFEVPGAPAVMVAPVSVDSPIVPKIQEGMAVRVLLVEDNLVNQMVAVGLLEMMSAKVTTARNGQEAVEAFQDGKFSILFMDCQMPILDGYQATLRIREIEGGRSRTPIVALTSNALRADVERCLAAGMDDHLSKPIVAGELKKKLERWADLSPKERG